MRWEGSIMSIFMRTQSVPVDPHAEALDTTLRDLRRVSSELRRTNDELMQRVESLKKESDANASPR